MGAIVVVGAGLAGASLALRLARAGRQVVLLERDTFPRHKLCGEFLSPESQDELLEVGALDTVLEAQPARIRRARFTTERGAQLGLRLPGEGLGLSRFALDGRLVALAEQAGATVRTGVEVHGVERAEDALLVHFGDRRAPDALVAAWVVMAHGRRARLDHSLRRPFIARRHPFVGLKRHHRPVDGGALAAELSDHVEIHAFEGGYCGMSFVEGGVVNVCMLLEAAAASEGARWDEVRARRLSRNPALAARLDGLVPAEDRTHAVAQIPFGPKARFEDGVLFVGDAAGIIAPLTGDGQAMALSSAAMLGRLLARAPERPRPSERAELGGRWDLAWRRRYAVRLALAAPLQARLLDPARADRTVRAVARVPGLADLLGRLTRG